MKKIIDIVINQAGYYGIPRDVAMLRAQKYLTLLELWDKRHHQAKQLSGGMKRRLMIARALVHEPKLLILDEPTAGVDVEIRRSMWHFLRQLNVAGRTIILTTHYLEEAETLCDRIAIINQGKIIQDTAKKQLLNQLSQETLILDLAKPMEALSVEANHFTFEVVDEMTLQVTLEKNTPLNELFSILNEQGITVMSMRNKTNRLEELFVRLTSK